MLRPLEASVAKSSSQHHAILDFLETSRCKSDLLERENGFKLCLQIKLREAKILHRNQNLDVICHSRKTSSLQFFWLETKQFKFSRTAKFIVDHDMDYFHCSRIFCSLEMRCRFLHVLCGLCKNSFGENLFPIVRNDATLFYREALMLQRNTRVRV